MRIVIAACLIATASCHASVRDEDDASVTWPSKELELPSEAPGETSACPATELYLPEECEEGITCRFTYDDMYMCMTRTFSCKFGHWWVVTDDCNDPECPLDKPTADSDCAADGVHCKYEGHYCPWLLSDATCDGGRWSVAEPECGNEPWNGGIGSPQLP
jgi:hypothetical protein